MIRSYLYIYHTFRLHNKADILGEAGLNLLRWHIGYKTGRDYDYFADYRIQSGNLEQFHLRNDNLVIRQIFLTIKI